MRWSSEFESMFLKHDGVNGSLWRQGWHHWAEGARTTDVMSVISVNNLPYFQYGFARNSMYLSLASPLSALGRLIYAIGRLSLLPFSGADTPFTHGEAPSNFPPTFAVVILIIVYHYLQFFNSFNSNEDWLFSGLNTTFWQLYRAFHGSKNESFYIDF